MRTEPARRTHLSFRVRVGVAALLACAVQGGAARQPIRLSPGMVIDRSVTIARARYVLPSASLDTPAITIRGEDITVDFDGAALVGGPDANDPDAFTGLGIQIDGGRRVTLKNAVVRGYKVGVFARKSPDLHLSHNDLSYNWKQRLYSGVEKESLVDWMSYHQNEKDEWLRYGAGIYLSECDRAELDHNTVVQGQNGLMVRNSTGLKIWNNRFQFLSAIGVGLYRVTDSAIMHNHIDWCVRGYSQGFYNRGQDSAGLLMYEQTSGNRVAYNSITHGGDGLFLWAGQSTMDTGQGGSNDNYFYGNDFSHAPANGIEATFSRNTFVANRIEESWHGVWGGYSWESRWISNRFARNTDAIAIEHGQNNEIVGNTFDRDETAVRLWQNPTQDPDWGYPRHRDTRSRGYVIGLNKFLSNKAGIDLRDTRDVTAVMNVFDSVREPLRRAGDTDGFADEATAEKPLRHPGDPGLVAPLPALDGGIDPMIKPGQRRGREFIIVDEWGPYDWKSPKLWPAGRSEDLPLKLRVLGPEGGWTIASVRGATVSPRQGRIPGEVVVSPSSTDSIDFRIELEYRGTAVISPRGARSAAGAPYRFSYSRFFAPIDWQVRFHEYTDATDPVKAPSAFARLTAGKPIKNVSTNRLDYISGRAIEEGVPRDRFAIVAEGSTNLPRGDYTLQVISDDGVRVWVDGVLAIDSWAPHQSTVDRVTISGGRKRFRVEYYEASGFAELRFDIQKRASTP